MRCPFRICRAELELVTDALGRVTERCPGCTRRRAGLCACCPRRVAGTLGKAKYCAACKVLTGRRLHREWKHRYYEEVVERAKARRRLDPRHPLSSEESGRRGGLLGGPARSAALSPARRKEIARLAARARWGRARNAM